MVSPLFMSLSGTRDDGDLDDLRMWLNSYLSSSESQGERVMLYTG
jgi:hypothetical protein